MIEVCQIFLVPSWSSSMPLYPSIMLQARECALTLCSSIVFSLRFTFESLKEFGTCKKLDGSPNLLGTYGQWNTINKAYPHIHLLLIFPPEQKVSRSKDINRLVSMELPLLENAPLFETFTKCLLHRRCVQEYPSAPCMVNGVCKKCYSQAFSEEMTHGEDGYPIYCQ